MQRFILTGAPGAGKTVILRALERRGYPVIEEAATDVCATGQALGNAEPWTSPGFIDDIVELQRRRQQAAATLAQPVQVFDRSPVCTQALARFLGFPESKRLTAELQRIERESVYDRRVLFVESLDVMVNTEIRRISLAEARRFGDVHEAAYRALGYELVRIAPGPPEERAAEAARQIAAARI